MISLPKWMRDAFKNSVCPYCEAACNKSGVYGIGIREERKKRKKIPHFAFFFEYHCPECDKESVYTGFQTSFEDFIGDCIDISELPFSDDTSPPEEKPKKKTEGMTDQEVEDAKKFLDSCATFEEFIDKLGIPDQFQIDKNDKDETDENK